MRVKFGLDTNRRYLPTAGGSRIRILGSVEPEDGVIRQQLNLCVVIDRSGSMKHDRKLKRGKEAAEMLMDELDSEDTFSVVAFSRDAETIIRPSTPSGIDPGALRSIKISGNTNIAAGIDRGVEEIRKSMGNSRISRIVLLSDGCPTAGPRSPGYFEKKGIELSRICPVIAIGIGEDFNEVILSNLARPSGGNFYYLENADEIRVIFAKELGRMKAIALEDVRVDISLSSGVSVVDVASFPHEIRDRVVAISLPPIQSGSRQEFSFTLRTEQKEPGEYRIARAKLSWTAPDGSMGELSSDLTVNFSGDESLTARIDPVIDQKTRVLSATDTIPFSLEEDDFDSVRKAIEELRAAGYDKAAEEIEDEVRKGRKNVLDWAFRKTEQIARGG